MRLVLTNPTPNASLDKDVRFTPKWLYDDLNAVFGAFGCDAAALPDNAMHERFITAKEDALVVDWAERSQGRPVFVNPPFSMMEAFTCRAAQMGRKVRVVMLMPGNRTEQPFWHKYVLPFASWTCDPIGRVQYGGTGDQCPFPSVVVVWEPGIRATMGPVNIGWTQLLNELGTV